MVLDYSIDLRPAGVQSSYRFELDDIEQDQPVWLQQDNLRILLIRRSNTTIRQLRDNLDVLQDAESKRSRQPPGLDNLLRSQSAEYFVSFGLGTLYGCPLQNDGPLQLGEVCSDARYDYAGRALQSKNTFQNLTIPDYNFSADYKTLIVRP